MHKLSLEEVFYVEPVLDEWKTSKDLMEIERSDERMPSS